MLFIALAYQNIIIFDPIHTLNCMNLKLLKIIINVEKCRQKYFI